MASLLKLLLLLFSIAFVFCQSSDKKTQDASKSADKSRTADTSKSPDKSNGNNYGDVIEKIKSELGKLNIDALGQYDKDMSNSKKELNRISQV